MWDTAGTERFRSVSRSYYRGAAGAILVYDVTSHTSFRALNTFLSDARALASPQLAVMLVGNKVDVADPEDAVDTMPSGTPASVESRGSTNLASSLHGSVSSARTIGLGSRNTATMAGDGREVSTEEASRWAATQDIPVAVEVSALTGENVDEVFARLARKILTMIELGEINPDDPQSGIQYGDISSWEDNGSIRSTVTDGPRRRKRPRQGTNSGWMSGMQDWEEVFSLDRRRNRNRCC